jgi:cytochrome c biogenesis factor
MTAPLFYFTDCCFQKIPFERKEHKPKQIGNRLLIVAPLLDALVSLTCLVVGILGATSILALPPAASYTFIGISGAMTIGWLCLILAFLCKKSPE